MYTPLMFEPINPKDRINAEVSAPSKSYWQDVYSRLRKDPLAVFGFVIIVLVLFMAVFAPMLSKYEYDEQDYMASNECFHFTELKNLYSIMEKGLEPRLDKNSKVVGDRKVKVSYSDSKIGAIALYANFYEVYTNYKNGSRKPDPEKPEEQEIYEIIKKSKSIEDFLGKGVYLLFDGTEIENDGGNTGKGGIYDASTTSIIKPEMLKVGLVRNNDTKRVSYSMYDYINYLMSTLTPEEYSQMISSMQNRYDNYCRDNKKQIDKFRNGNYSKKELNLRKFCEVCKDDIDKAILKDKKNQEIYYDR